MDYHQQSYQRYVLPELVRRDIGIIAMKTSADGALLREHVCSIAERRALLARIAPRAALALEWYKQGSSDGRG